MVFSPEFSFKHCVYQSWAVVGKTVTMEELMMLRWEGVPKAKVEKRESGVSFVHMKLSCLLVIICRDKIFKMKAHNDVLVVVWLQF